MTRLHAAALPALTGILAVLCGIRPAFADGPPCPSMAIEADASVRTRWPGLTDRVREAFEARDDIDRCARVTLTSHGAGVSVAAVLPDGRSAMRSVPRQDDVIPTLEALLLVPQAGAREAAPPSAQAQTAAVEPSVSGPLPASSMATAPSGVSSPATHLPSGPRPVADRDASAAPPGPSPSGLRIELSVLTGARAGDDQVGLGLGASSLLDLSGWLVGFEGRADRYRTLAPGWPAASVLELALLAGRRMRFGTIALDLIAGSGLVLQGTTTFTSTSAANASTPPGGNQVTGSSSSSVPRLLLGARVNLGALSTLRTFVGVDGEVGPSRLGDGGEIPQVPRLPVWTLGLALGGTVGTL